MNHVIRPMSRSLLRMAVPCRAAFFVALSMLLGCFSPACGFARSQAAISAAAMVEGKVRNSAGEPVSGALATLTDSSGKKISQTTSDAHGEFQLSAPQAGAFSLRAEKMGAGKSKLQSIRLAAGERRHVEGVLMKEAADTAAAGIEFADDPGFTVAGVILLRCGRGAAAGLAPHRNECLCDLWRLVAAGKGPQLLAQGEKPRQPLRQS